MARNDQNAGSTPIQGGQVPLSSYIGQTDVDLDPYPTHYAQLGGGGYRSMAAFADMLAISADMRQEGMLVYVEDRQIIYILDADLVTWRLYSTGLGGLPDFINRIFTNEVLIEFDNVPRLPIIQIYLDEGQAIGAPFLYGNESTALYNSVYNRESVDVIRRWEHEQQLPVYECTYSPELQRVSVTFDVPRSGTLVGVF